MDLQDSNVPWVGRRASIGILLGLATLVGVIAWQAVRAHRLEVARQQVESWAERLDAHKNPDGSWQHLGPVLEVRDPWGTPMTVRYERTLSYEKLEVRSNGPDREAWSADDITRTVNNVSWLQAARDAADAVEEVATGVSRGVVGGAIEGVVRHLPKTMQQNLGVQANPTPGQTPAPKQ